MNRRDEHPLEHERTRVGGLAWHALAGGYPADPPVVVVPLLAG